MIRRRAMPQSVQTARRGQVPHPGDLLLATNLPEVLQVAGDLSARGRAEIERAAQRLEPVGFRPTAHHTRLVRW